MGLFDAIVDTYFKQDVEGRDLIFPYGNLGAGYLLSSKKQKDDISQYLKKVYTVVLPCLCLIGVLFGWISAALFLVFLIWHYFFFRNLTARLELSQERMEFSELVAIAAHSSSLISLIVTELVFVILILWGILVVVDTYPVAAAVGVGILTVFSPLIVAMIIFKIRRK